MTAVSEARMKHLSENGDKRAEIVERLIDKKADLISTMLLASNLINILASALATSLFITIFGDFGIIISTIIMTTLVVIFGEILPKLLALKYNDYWVLVSSYLMELTMKILGPISNVATRISYLFLRNNKEISLLVDPHDEIRGQINLHHEDGIVKKGDKDMLGGVLDLPEVTVEDVMTHRKNILTIDCDTNHDDVLSIMLENPYTRVPIWKNDKDNFIGVLHIKDLLKKSISKEEFAISDILVEPWFVPETTSLKEQLSAFLEKKTHMALVVDEYGALMGLITLEDILEEIVGQITDEHDVENEDILPEEANMIKVEGDSSIRDLNREYGWKLPDDEAATIAGLIIHETRSIPKKGSIYSFHGFRFKILDRQRNQLTSIRIQKEI
tara:strand:- start:236 stop:1393 length:1158 start_codon:yes stop_codon:yes gene_type:complete